MARKKVATKKVTKAQKENGKQIASQAKVVDLKDIFQRGLLVDFKWSSWFAQVKLNDLGDLDPEVVKATQSLLTKDDRLLLKDIQSVIRDQYVFIRAHSLDFPIRGLQFVPIGIIGKLNDRFEENKKRFDELVELLLDRYDELRSNFKKEKPKYFKEYKYPSKAALEKKFRFEWRYIRLDPPDKSVGSLVSPDFVKEEERKFKATIDEMGEMLKSSVAKLLLEKIDNLRNRCYDENVHGKTVTAIRRALDSFQQVFDDFIISKDLKQCLKEVRDYVGDDKEDIARMKEDDIFRNEVAEKMGEAMDTIISVTGSEYKPKRALMI